MQPAVPLGAIAPDGACHSNPQENGSAAQTAGLMDGRRRGKSAPLSCGLALQRSAAASASQPAMNSVPPIGVSRATAGGAPAARR